MYERACNLPQLNMASTFMLLVIYVLVKNIHTGYAGDAEDCDTLAVFIDHKIPKYYLPTSFNLFPLDGLEFHLVSYTGEHPVFYNSKFQYKMSYEPGCSWGGGWIILPVTSPSSSGCISRATSYPELYLRSGPDRSHPADIAWDATWYDATVGDYFTGLCIECQDSRAPSFTAEITMSLVVISVSTALILLRRCCRCRKQSVFRRWTESHNRSFSVTTLNCAASVLLMIATFSVHWVVQQRVVHHGLFQYCTPRRCDWTVHQHVFWHSYGLRAMQALMISSCTASLVSAITALLCASVNRIRHKRSVAVVAAVFSYVACGTTIAALIVFNTAKKLHTPPSASYGIAVLGLATQALSSVLFLPWLYKEYFWCTCKRNTVN